MGRIPHSSLLGILNNVDKQNIDLAIEQTGLQKITNKELSKISDGQRQRAFIARLLAQQTSLMIFDEPTAFLDIEGKIKIVSLFSKIAKEQNKIIVFSTHDINLALRFCDKIWLLLPDKFIAAAPEDLVLQNEFQKLFPDSEIKFNNFTADFYVSKPIIDSIKIINYSSDLRYLWTTKAIERFGFKIEQTSSNQLIINDNSWYLQLKNKKYEVFSIEQLQQTIEKN